MQNQIVKGFKAMEPDMTCRGFHYKVGETFHHQGPVVPCESGFHFCQDIKDISYYYPTNSRLFEVEASGEIVQKGDKTVTNTLTIVKEIDYNDYIDHRSIWIRAVIAGRGVGLDTLVHDESWKVRYNVAEQGYGLDILINDIDNSVRIRAINKLQELKNAE